MSRGSAQGPAPPGGPLRLPGRAWWHCHPGPPLYIPTPFRVSQPHMGVACVFPWESRDRGRQVLSPCTAGPPWAWAALREGSQLCLGCRSDEAGEGKREGPPGPPRTPCC